VPEVTQVGRRTGRAELDEHAEGVHYGEIDVDLKPRNAHRERSCRHPRSALQPAGRRSNVGQPISHRLDHLLSGVRAQIALKIFGDDLDTLRGLAEEMRDRLATVPGWSDLQIEKAGADPADQDPLDYEQAARYGVAPGEPCVGCR
jgi:HME family heavy-metal exporter